MAHLPRWILSEKCDSVAMFSAFLKFLHDCDDEEIRTSLRCLTFIVHQGPDGYQPAHVADVVMVPCRKDGCKRCYEAWGGYVFRWYDQRWYSDYVRLKREGAWTLGADERTLCCRVDIVRSSSDDYRDGWSENASVMNELTE